MHLELEYSCTEVEKREAQNLQLRHQIGGGSIWRTRLVLSGLCVLAALTVCVKFKTLMANERLIFGAILVLVLVGVEIFKRVAAQKGDRLVHLEVSDTEVVFSTRAGARTSMLWSGFGQCLESPNLFVLVDRSKTMLLPVPKRAFRDESARNWFRTLANRASSTVAATGAPLHPGRFVAANGIALTLHLRFRDYLARSFVSWRIRGLVIFVLLVVTATTFATPSAPDAVNSPLNVYLWMLGMVALMLPIALFLAASISWRLEKKFRVPQQIVVTSQGLEFADQDASGRLVWSSYKYYLENRWYFFIWNPRGSIWLMFPKREFASAFDLEQFRAIVETNLTSSRWFYL